MRQEYKKKLQDYYTQDKEYFNELDRHFYKNVKQYTQKLPKKMFQDKLVLEAGCGSGAMANWLQGNWNSKVIGIDFSLYALTRAKKKYSAGYVQGDLERLPFKDDSFDTVLLFDVLEHIVYPEMMFKEFHRVLKKGGHFIIVSPNLMFNPRVPWGTKILETLDILNPGAKFRYVNPITDACACGDQEATLITNPIKVMRRLRRTGFKMVKKNFVRCSLIAKK